MPMPFPTVKDGVYSVIFDCYSISPEESAALNEKAQKGEMTEEDAGRVLGAMHTLLFVFEIDGGRLFPVKRRPFSRRGRRRAEYRTANRASRHYAGSPVCCWTEPCIRTGKDASAGGVFVGTFMEKLAFACSLAD